MDTVTLRRIGLLVRAFVAAGVLAVLVAGIPWGLARYVGWPLPGHIPSTAEAVSFLSSPLTTGPLLDVLACALWVAWAVFVVRVLNVVGEVVAIASPCAPLGSRTGPLRVLAAALVGGVVLALAPTRESHAAALQADTGTTAVVRPPRKGIHDSLWRIAERRLGDGSLWPQIFELNRDRRQPDGRALIHPDLIQPGWVLRLPLPSTPPPDDDHGGATPRPSSPSSPPAERSTPPETATDREQHGGGSGTGPHLPDGTFVGIGLAAAIVGALAVARRRRRTRHRPGTGERGDNQLAPVIRTLRQEQETAPQQAVPPSQAFKPSEAGKQANAVSLQDGRALAWDMARTRGLGLVGPGAGDAVRALLLHLLTQQRMPGSAGAEIVISARDVMSLLGAEVDALKFTRHLHVVADQTDALRVMEAELLSRSRARHDDEGHGDAKWAELVLLTRVQTVDVQRLQAVLDNGSALGLAAILIGHWPLGTTLRMRADGTVAVAAPAGVEVALGGARLFSVPMEDARALVELLADSAASRTSARSDKHTIGVHVLGAVRLTYEAPNAPVTTEITDVLTQKQRELLAFLTLHPDGARRETVAATLWPEAPHSRPYNSLNATLSQVRRALRSATGGNVFEATLLSDGRHALDKDQIAVDLWEFKSALASARRLVDHQERAGAGLQQAADVYKGDFAEDVVAEWAETPREEIRRDYLDAISTLVQYLRQSDPRHALHLLERARERDPYNEALYQDIARLQAQLGLLDAVRRTLELLKRSLAEIDEEPSPSMVRLCEALLGPNGHGTESPAGPV